MSNKRKLKRPKHECSEEGRVWHVECSDPSCGYTDDIPVCDDGTDQFLYEMGVWTTQAECPECKREDVFRIRPGREWLGETRVVAECDNGCTPAALRAALIGLGVDEDCLGDFGTPGERTALYRMFDAEDRLLYVGISKDFGQRWKSEARQFEWWQQVKRQTVDWRDTRDEALAAEEEAIITERPLHNKQHAGKPKPTLGDWGKLDWHTRLGLRAEQLGYPLVSQGALKLHLDDPETGAAALRKHMPPGQLEALRKLLSEESP